MRKALVVGNWKMNASRLLTQKIIVEVANRLSALPDLQELRDTVDIAICPAFVYLAEAADNLKNSPFIKLGAQDVSAYTEGAYTGQISAKMLLDLGCRYVIVGHSERRQYICETDEQVGDKFIAAQTQGLIPILCVGESLEEREANRTEQVVLRQLTAVINKAGIAAFRQAVVAYEPVWAIGTGKTATPEEAQAVHACIRDAVGKYDQGVANLLQILYGGSLKGANASSLCLMPDIDGGLVGGAALDPEDFTRIIVAAVQKIKEFY